MAKLPSIERQRLLPTTTGAQRLQAVKVYDPVAEAIGNAGNLVVGIQNKMFEADSAAQLSAANVNTQMELGALEVELSKGNSETAMNDYAVRSQAIYAKNSEGMSPLVQQQYDANFGTLSTKTNLSLVSTIATKRSGERVAGVLSLLDEAVQFGGAATDEFSREGWLIQGIASIDALVQANDLKPAKAAKWKLKFIADFNNEVITNWSNNIPLGELDDAYIAMNEGNLGDPSLNTAWKALDATRRAAVVSGAIANQSRLLSAKDAAERREEDDLIEAGDLALKELWDRDTTEERQQELLQILRKNRMVDYKVYREAEDALSGRTGKLDDPDEVDAMYLNIAQNAERLTNADISGSFSGPQRERFIAQLAAQKNEQFTKTLRVLEASNLFHFGTALRKRIYSLTTGQEALDAMRRDLETEMYAAQYEARTQEKAFNPIEYIQNRLEEIANPKKESTVNPAPYKRAGAIRALIREHNLPDQAAWDHQMNTLGILLAADPTDELRLAWWDELAQLGTDAGYKRAGTQ